MNLRTDKMINLFVSISQFGNPEVKTNKKVDISGMGTVKILAHRKLSMLEQLEVEIIWTASSEFGTYRLCEQ